MSAPTSDERIISKAARLRRIEHRLYNSPHGMRVAEMAAYCGVDRRTIYRDLLSLDEMGVPIWEQRGRFGIDRSTYLSTIRLNVNEAIALFFAARLLAHHSDEHNPHIVSALDKLAAGLPDQTISAHLTRVADLVRTRPLRHTYVHTLEVLTRAWADRHIVRIRYRAVNRELTEREIAPYLLEVSRSEPAAYVIGYDRLRGALRTFKIERIEHAELLDEHYTIPNDFDPYAYLASAWGVMDDVAVEVRLRFTAAVAQRVRESVWHHSQHLDELPNGGCMLSVVVGGIREIREWVLSWGAEVEVLAPPELRAEVAAQAQRMVEQYR